MIGISLLLLSSLLLFHFLKDRRIYGKQPCKQDTIKASSDNSRERWLIRDSLEKARVRLKIASAYESIPAEEWSAEHDASKGDAFAFFWAKETVKWMEYCIPPFIHSQSIVVFLQRIFSAFKDLIEAIIVDLFDIGISNAHRDSMKREDRLVA